MIPLFIFSLPRSGSTLLQRILMSTGEIASDSEPWILLPFIYSLKSGGSVSIYSNRHSRLAIEDFISTVDGGREQYNVALREFISKLYATRCSADQVFYLDKTPRYHYIIDEIVHLFPNAKFIFLIRDLRDVFASCISTFGEGSLKSLQEYHDDLTVGSINLLNGFKKYSSKSFLVRYEDLVNYPNIQLEGLCKYLGIKFKEDILTRFIDKNLLGVMGDKIGVKNFKKLSTDSIGNWSDVFSTFLRRRLLKAYLKKVPDEFFETFDYNRNSLMKEVVENKCNALSKLDGVDFYYMVRSFFIRRYNIQICMKHEELPRMKFLS